MLNQPNFRLYEDYNYLYPTTDVAETAAAPEPTFCVHR